MRHRVKGRHLNRTPSHLLAMKRNMVAQIVAHEKIVTTVAKAKEMRGFTERLITIAKKGAAALDAAEKETGVEEKKSKLALALHYRRRLIQILGGKPKVPVGGDKTVNVIEKLLQELGVRYANRHGGYTRVLKRTQRRIGDSAPTAIFQLLAANEPVGAKKEAKSKMATNVNESAGADAPAS